MLVSKKGEGIINETDIEMSSPRCMNLGHTKTHQATYTITHSTADSPKGHSEMASSDENNPNGGESSSEGKGVDEGEQLCACVQQWKVFCVFCPDCCLVDSDSWFSVLCRARYGDKSEAVCQRSDKPNLCVEKDSISI